MSVPLPQGEDKARTVRDLFDAIAPRYDLVNRVMTFGMDVGWRRRTVRELRLPSGSLVFDLACGTGDLCRELERAGYRAVGLDFAFSVPAWYLHALGVAGAPELWDAAAVDGESWLSACQAPFWGRKGAGKPTGQEHFRRTELETPPVGPGVIERSGAARRPS